MTTRLPTSTSSLLTNQYRATDLYANMGEIQQDLTPPSIDNAQLVDSTKDKPIDYTALLERPDIGPFSFMAYLPGGEREVASTYFADSLKYNRIVLERLQAGTLIPDFSSGDAIKVGYDVLRDWWESFPELIGPLKFNASETWNSFAARENWLPGGLREEMV